MTTAQQRIQFRLLGEGPTDRAVIENILAGFLDSDEFILDLLPPLEVPPVQPGKKAPKQPPPTNWTSVLRDCAGQQFRDLFAFDPSLYVIIHIDSDTLLQWKPPLVSIDALADLTIEQFVLEIKNYLISRMNAGEAGFYEVHRDRIIFAIAVDSIECWLLPLYYAGHGDRKQREKAARLQHCLGPLNEMLKREKPSYSLAVEGKDARLYSRASYEYGKPKQLARLAPHNPSLHIFIQELAAKFTSDEPDPTGLIPR